MRWTVVLAGSILVTACGSASTGNSSATPAVDAQASREAIARRADNPDFSAVDALANQTAGAVSESEAVGSASATAATAMPVVTDPRSAIEAAIRVSARGDDGIKTLPLAPDLLVALRRVEARGEVSTYDHDFLTGGQEPLPVRILGSTSRRTASGVEVTHRIENAAGPRTLTSVWSPRGDGSWQLDDVRAEGTTLLTLLTADGS